MYLSRNTARGRVFQFVSMNHCRGQDLDLPRTHTISGYQHDSIVADYIIEVNDNRIVDETIIVFLLKINFRFSYKVRIKFSSIIVYRSSNTRMYKKNNEYKSNNLRRTKNKRILYQREIKYLSHHRYRI